MEYVSSYRALWETGELKEREKAAWERLRCCSLCGHECGVDRLSGETGICEADDTVLISSWGPHFGEEPPLVGRCGSVPYSSPDATSNACSARTGTSAKWEWADRLAQMNWEK